MELSRSLMQLRYNLGMTQDEFSERLQVSKRSVQNWEAGMCLPDCNTLMKISKEFAISLDALLMETHSRVLTEHTRSLFPGRERVYTERYESGLNYEYTQCNEEGLDVGPYKSLFEVVQKLPNNEYKREIANTIFSIVLNLNMRPNYQFIEPSDLDTIRIACKKHQLETSPEMPSWERQTSKVRGAWIGRICGCLLGKPVEGMRVKELVPFLKESKNYPMNRYIKSSDITEEVHAKYTYSFWSKAFADQLDYAPFDDDTNYTILNALMIEKYGFDFTPSNVLEFWESSQPKSCYATAEKVALLNFFRGYETPDTAINKNPYREWIGAQIRADYFGYICPGDPERAAELAWRDASNTHVKNGIYGEMYVAAMLACAAVYDSMRDVVLGGLSQIPSSSRLYDAISQLLSWYDKGFPMNECRRKIYATYNDEDQYYWCYTIPNAMIVTMSLLYADSYTTAIGMAVESGFDTDCNGATVGSIWGMLYGASAIGAEWWEPLHNGIESTVICRKNECTLGHTQIYTIDELVDLTLSHIKYFKDGQRN